MNHTPNPPPELLWLRFLRALALLALMAALTGLLGLVLTSQVMFPLFAGDEPEIPRWFGLIFLSVLVALPFGLLWLAYRLRLRSWWWIGGGFLAIAPALAYLAADDPAIRRPLGIEEIAPSFPGAEESYRVLMRYAKGSPEANAFKLTVWGAPQKTEELPAWLEANRAKIEAAWAELAPERAWYDELNAFDRIGDLGAARHDAPIIAFAPHRSLVQTAAHRARLLALDGRGDEAVATVLPMLEVGRKLHVTSRTLVRALTGLSNRSAALDAVEFTLGRTTVSPGARARLLAALGSPTGEAGARRLVAIEYAYWASGAITDYHVGPDSAVPAVIRVPLNLVAPLLINPNRTINEAGDMMAELQELAARRQPVVSSRRDLLSGTDLGVKNLGGSLMLATSIPAYDRVIESYWKFEDRLAALRARLPSG